MDDKRRFRALVCVILTTLADLGNGIGAPEGVLYLGLQHAPGGCTLDDWAMIKAVLLAGPKPMAVSLPGPSLQATAAGRDLARRILAAAGDKAILHAANLGGAA